MSTGVEDGASERLSARREDGGYDEQADGEEDVEAQELEDLCGKRHVPIWPLRLDDSHEKW